VAARTNKVKQISGKGDGPSAKAPAPRSLVGYDGSGGLITGVMFRFTVGRDRKSAPVRNARGVVARVMHSPAK